MSNENLNAQLLVETLVNEVNQLQYQLTIQKTINKQLTIKLHQYEVEPEVEL